MVDRFCRTLAEAGVGAALLLVAFRMTKLKPVIRAVALRAGVFELIFTFVVYPLMSYAGFEDDWLVIYRFEATPVPSALALAATAAVVLWLFLSRDRIEKLFGRTLAPRIPRPLERRGWREFGRSRDLIQFWHPAEGGLITFVAKAGHEFGPRARASIERAVQSPHHEPLSRSDRTNGR
jgi:hypothetical protein